ncbi:MAG: LytR C-terminal domain-containing protein [Patescibacteria group bacterium]|jgi:cytoskeletal protein RodZ
MSLGGVRQARVRKMGIADDIRPKKNKKKIAEESEEVKEPEIGDGELVSISHGKGHDFVASDIEEQLEREKNERNEYDEDSEYDEDNEHENMSDYFYRNSRIKEPKTKRKGSFGKWLILILVLALVGIIIWQNLDSIKSYFGIANSKENTNTDNSNLYSDFSVNSSSQPTSQPTVQENTTPNASSDSTAAAETPDKSIYTISVLNGNGIKGSAAGVTSALANAGYTVTNTGNALKFSYINSIVYYKTGKADVANAIKTVLSDRTIELSEDNTITGNYDIVIVVGKT